jgi:hypothetical protein
VANICFAMLFVACDKKIFYRKQARFACKKYHVRFREQKELQEFAGKYQQMHKTPAFT